MKRLLFAAALAAAAVAIADGPSPGVQRVNVQPPLINTGSPLLPMLSLDANYQPALDGGYVDLVHTQTAILGDKGFAQNVGIDAGLVVSKTLIVGDDAGFRNSVEVGNNLQVDALLQAGLMQSLVGNFLSGQMLFDAQLSDLGTGVDFQFFAVTTRTHGFLLELDNGVLGGSGTRLQVDPDGNVAASIGGHGLATTAAFLDANGQSGHTSLGCRGGPTGCYTVVQGGLVQWADTAMTIWYGGIHGEENVEPLNPRDAGFLFQVGEHAFTDFRGASVQITPQSVANFDYCGARLIIVDAGNPVPGQHYMNEFDSAFRWAADHKYYVCEDNNPDGGEGNWGAVCTDTNGGCDNRYALAATVGGGNLAGLFPGSSTSHGVNKISVTRIQHAIASGPARISYNFFSSTGVTGGTFDLVLKDTTASATLCSFTGITCNQSLNSAAGHSCTISAAAQFDDVEFQADTTNCTGSNDPVFAARQEW